jgi:hypothetical protein
LRERNLNDAISNAKRGSGISGEFESRKRRDRIDIFSQR